MPKLLVAACAALVVLAASATGAAGEPDPGPPSLASPAPAAAAAPAWDHQDLGVTMLAMWSDWDKVDQLFNRLATMKVRTMRVDTGWCTLEEHGKGVISTWYQDRLDYVVAKANSLGIELLVMVGCTPEWAGGTTFHDFPAKPAEYQRIMTYLSSRYAGRVAAWEIWSEPDCVGGCGASRPSEYLPVLKAGFRGVRAGDPGALVVTGGTSGNNVSWIRGLYEAGGKRFFDVMATHPYIHPTDGPPETQNDTSYDLTKVLDVRAVMDWYGDTRKPVWFTEFGWTTDSDESDRPPVTPRVQAQYLTRAMEMIVEAPWITRSYWFTLRDRDDSTPFENAFGLMTRGMQNKPAYTAFRNAVAALEP